MINANRPFLWKEDIIKSVDLYNTWFMAFAPKAYRDTRVETTEQVQIGLESLNDLMEISPEQIIKDPSIISVLRMCTCPPLARDRLTGLGYLNTSIVQTLEGGNLPKRMLKDDLKKNLKSICNIIIKLLDKDIFTWIETKKIPTKEEKHRAATVIADRLCGAVADPIIRNSQEQRQLKVISEYLEGKGYKRKNHPTDTPITAMENGTYNFRMNIPVTLSNGENTSSINIPIDVVVKKKNSEGGEYPILIECKSAGDFTNTNKRRKEEAVKIAQLKSMYGDRINLTLFLCGYFDSGYLGYEAAEGLDWVWEHRIIDMEFLGL